MQERKFRILQAIIDDYILTAMPVGSRTISKKYVSDLSSATIRNEMSDLEELGYLVQPHVSAGRIPSAKAYKLYVEHLIKIGAINPEENESIRNHFRQRTGKMEDVINRAAQVLGSITHYTSLIVSPKSSEMKIRNLQLVPVSTTSALLVIVTDGGIVRDSVIDVDSQLDTDALYAISTALTQRLTGHTLKEATSLLESMAKEFAEKRAVFGEIGELIKDVETQQNKSNITIGGTSNILSYPEYNDIEKARAFLSMLETKDKLSQLLEQKQGVAFTVRIGPETGVPELAECSLVTATYSIGGYTHGTIGVIGPTRMEYSRVISALSTMGEELTRLFSKEKE